MFLKKTFFSLFLICHFSSLTYAKDSHRIAAVANVSQISGDKSFKTKNNNDIAVIRVPAIDKHGKIVQPKYRFYIEGGLHGDETLTSQFVAWLTNRVIKNKGPLSKIPRSQAAFDFVPVANPDGAKSADRYNGSAINLNRNFGHLWGISRENPGPSKFSEPETRAIKYLFEKNKYTAAVDVHGYVNWIVGPTKPASKKHIFAKRYRAWSSALVSEMKKFDPTYEYKTAGALGDGGAFEDWAFWEQNSLAFCLEMASAFRYEKIAPNKKIDLFEKYELLISNMFKHAMEIDSVSKIRVTSK